MKTKPKLIPIKYRGRDYGHGIKPTIKEVPGHFDVQGFDKKISQIDPEMEYSLHTEYSFEERNFDCPVFSKIKLEVLKVSSSCKRVPLLWHNDDWSEQFCLFITNLIGDNHPPKIIEIHPPFKNDCGLSLFLKRYSSFERLIRESMGKNLEKIVIENRTESNYKKSKFLVSSDLDIKDLLLELKKNGKPKLELVLDIPQLITALKEKNGWETPLLNKSRLGDVELAFDEIGKENRDLIAGIHIYGRKNQRAHAGNLDGLFESPDQDLKEKFLEVISGFFDDGIPRYVVPEVNFANKDDFNSIVSDLRKCFDLSGKLE